MTIQEAVHVNNQRIDINTGKELEHNEFYERVIDFLGGLDAVKKYVPFDVETLRKAYKQDKHFNNLSLSVWDHAAGYYFTHQRAYRTSGPSLCDLYHKCDITCASVSEGVCILKTAARMLVKQTEEENKKTEKTIGHAIFEMMKDTESYMTRGVYNIGYADGNETQFDVDNTDELISLWNDYCKDENIPTNCVEYVTFAGKLDRKTYADEIATAFIDTDNASILTLTDMLRDYTHGINELKDIEDFINLDCENDTLSKKQLRCLWTAYCLHNDINVDTKRYDDTLSNLYTNHICKKPFKLFTSFDDFDAYMCEHLM